MDERNCTALNPKWRRDQAKMVLEKAKQLEAQKLATGAKYVKINSKTFILKKNEQHQCNANKPQPHMGKQKARV